MAGRKKTETVETEVVETAVVPAGKMEFRLIAFMNENNIKYGKIAKESK